MSRTEIKGFKGGFIQTELKSTEPRGRNKSTQNWQGSIDREESLSDPRWHKRKERKPSNCPNKSPLTARHINNNTCTGCQGSTIG